MMLSKSEVIKPYNKNLFQFNIEKLVEHLANYKVDDVVTYQKLGEVLESNDKEYNCRVFNFAKRRLENENRIFFKNKFKEGYVRVSDIGSVELTKTVYNQGFKKIVRAGEMAHNIPIERLPDGKKEEVINLRLVNDNFKRIKALAASG